jgi:sugar O-acyltransferase (sialic acid O-acetyltransferase NeuD family)
VFVAGTRTFAAEVVDMAHDAGLSVSGLLEPYEPARVGQRIHDQSVQWLDDGPAGGPAVALVATGESERRPIVERLGRAGFEVASLVHPTAHVAPSGVLGQGAILSPGVVIGARARLGDHTVLGRGALVGHHTTIGAFGTIRPGANVAGNVEMGTDVVVGMGALVRDHLTVGDSAVIAMGAVVLGDVRTGAQVRGLPAVEVPTRGPGPGAPG